jgi:hypothetical protein
MQAISTAWRSHNDIAPAAAAISSASANSANTPCTFPQKPHLPNHSAAV